METLERIIAKHPFFEGLDGGFTSLMVGCASNVAVPTLTIDPCIFAAAPLCFSPCRQQLPLRRLRLL